MPAQSPNNPERIKKNDPKNHHDEYSADKNMNGKQPHNANKEALGPNTKR